MLFVKFNPDIINFCEIQGCGELKYLRDDTTSNYDSYLIQGTDTTTGQNVGMLTKVDPLTDLERSEEHYGYPFNGSTCGYDGTRTTGVSKHFVTTFQLKDLKVAYISLHFIAYPIQPDRCAKREARGKM